jgi:heme oxygenase (biliverdin-IX-beta and delta-forming)
MFSAELKEKTKESHQALEAIVVRQIKAIRSKDDYVQLLHKFYGYHSPMEQRYDEYFSDGIIPHYSQRRKASLILRDLENLGINAVNIPVADNLPPINSPAEAIGSFYVLEGSTQGGSIVAGMLIRHAGLTPDTTSFFYAYGDGGKEMWQSFKEKMDSYFPDNNLRKEAIDAANATFTRFREWMVR